MTLYRIYWTPTQEQEFSQQFPELDVTNAEYVGPTATWPDGYNYVDQNLGNQEFGIVDGLANNHVCIDIKPHPVPPGNPLGR